MERDRNEDLSTFSLSPSAEINSAGKWASVCAGLMKISFL
jgi:hypothetical protein